jgi:hypothetical protein
MNRYNIEYTETRVVSYPEQPTGAITIDADTGLPYCRKLPKRAFPFILRCGGVSSVMAKSEAEARKMLTSLSKHLTVVRVEVIL